MCECFSFVVFELVQYGESQTMCSFEVSTVTGGPTECHFRLKGSGAIV